MRSNVLILPNLAPHVVYMPSHRIRETFVIRQDVKVPSPALNEFLLRLLQLLIDITRALFDPVHLLVLGRNDQNNLALGRPVTPDPSVTWYDDRLQAIEGHLRMGDSQPTTEPHLDNPRIKHLLHEIND